MRFDVLTIFPELFAPFAKESLLSKARGKNLLEIRAHDLRKWTGDRHNTVDDKPFGGGLGMVMRIEPIYRGVQSVKFQNTNSKFQTKHRTQIPNSKTRVILFSPRGRKFNQRKAFELSKYEQLIFICGRYEGVDERVKKYVADESLSLGDFDLMGGEVPAMAVIETVARLIPGVIGKKEFLEERVTEEGRGFVEHPQYTRPEVFEPEPGVKWKVPSPLTSGDHKRIEEWRRNHGKVVGKSERSEGFSRSAKAECTNDSSA